MIVPDRYNPCKSASEGKWFADALAKFFDWAAGGIDCHCCVFYRGVAAGAALATVFRVVLSS